MGSASKIILIGATSLIIGIYAVSLKKVQTNDVNTSSVDVKRVQIESVQAAAVRTAIDRFLAAPYYGLSNVASTRAQLGGDTTFTYSFTGTKKDTSSNLQLTVYQRNQYNVLVPRTITAALVNTKYISGASVSQGPRKMHRGTWQVTSFYVLREH